MQQIWIISWCTIMFVKTECTKKKVKISTKITVLSKSYMYDLNKIIIVENVSTVARLHGFLRLCISHNLFPSCSSFCSRLIKSKLCSKNYIIYNYGLHCWTIFGYMNPCQVISTSDTKSDFDLPSSVDIIFCIFGRYNLTSWAYIPTYWPCNEVHKSCIILSLARQLDLWLSRNMFINTKKMNCALWH